MRIATILVCVSMAGLIASVSCSSSKSSSSSGPSQCKGVYSDKTLEQITAGAKNGACTSSADLAAVCANDVNGTTSSCAVTCNTQGGDDATKLACTLKCDKDGLTPAPTDACLNCYIESVGCALKFCLNVCVAAPSGTDCTTCRVKNGCSPKFYNDCSGLPVPTGLNLNVGGASNGGASNGGTSSGGSSHGGASGAGTGGAAKAGSSNGGAGGAAGAH